MKPLLGGKGANLAEMTRIGLPVPPGFTITTEVCTYLLRAQADLSARRSRPKSSRLAQDGEISRATKFGDHGNDAAARLRPFRRARFHAGNDGHDSQSRDERRDVVKSSRRKRTTSVSPGIATAVSPDVRRRGHGRAKTRRRRSRTFRIVIEHFKDERYGKHDFDDVKLERGRFPGTRHALQETDQRADRQIISAAIRGNNFGARSARCSVRG